MCLNFVDWIVGSDLSNHNKALLIVSANSKESLDAIVEAIIEYTDLSDDDFSSILTLKDIYNQSELDPDYDVEFTTVWKQYLNQNKKRCDSVVSNGFIYADWIAAYITPEEMQKWLDSGVYNPDIICDLYDEHIYPQDASSALRLFDAKKFNITDYFGRSLGWLICQNLLTLSQAKEIIFGKLQEA